MTSQERSWSHPAFSRRCLVSLCDEVVGESLDDGAGVAGNSGLAMMGDDDGLLGFGNSETSPARSCVDAAALGAGHNESLATNKETLGESAVLGLVVTAHNGGDGLHLLGLHVEARRSSPDTVTSSADDGGLVDVAGANEAIEVSVHDST